MFDLRADPWETNDLAHERTEDVDRLIAVYQDWSRQLVDPLWLDPHGANIAKEEAARQAVLDAATRGEK